MKICLLGSAPTSLALAPFGDEKAQIWACSPGLYPHLPRCDEFFEVHRFEPGIIGKPATQKPWFSPEYVAWIGQQKRVWVAPKALEAAKTYWPNADAYPIDEMTQKFGNAFWTSSLAYMAAMAIDQILLARQNGDQGPHTLAFYGVDMAADSEVYSQQRAGCHYFIMLAHILGIQIEIPPESDLIRPNSRYGLDESEPWHIKGLARTQELTAQKQAHEANAHNSQLQAHFMAGALSDHDYHMRTWMNDRALVAPSPEILALSPDVVRLVDHAQFSDTKPVEGTLDQIANTALEAGMGMKIDLKPFIEGSGSVDIKPGWELPAPKKKTAKKTTKRK